MEIVNCMHRTSIHLLVNSFPDATWKSLLSFFNKSLQFLATFQKHYAGPRIHEDYYYYEFSNSIQFSYSAVKIADSNCNSSLSIRCKISMHNYYVALLLHMWWHSASTVLMAISAIVILMTYTSLREECEFP